MNSQLVWVLILLLIVVTFFMTNKIRMDVVALLVIVALVLSGTLTLKQATIGFSDPNVLLIAALFVFSEGLVRTGIAYQVGDCLVGVAGNNENKMLIFLMITVAGLGAFMSSTGIVAIFIPVVLNVAKQMRIPPGRFMMPLGFAGLISGMMTLVATPPNMIVNSELVREGYTGFKFFAITPIGIAVLLLAIIYMWMVRRWLGNREIAAGTNPHRRTFHDFIRDYKLSGRARCLAICPGSPLIGYSLDELHLRSRYGANVIGIERWHRFRRLMLSVTAATELHERDVLLVDISESEVDLNDFCHEQKLAPMILRGEYFSARSREVGMAEFSLAPQSELLGSTLREIKFRTRYGLNVVGIYREGKTIDDKLIDQPMRLGDILLIVGDWKLIRLLSTDRRNFIVLNLAAEVEAVAPATSQAPHAIFCLVLMVTMMAIDEIPNFIAVLIACLLMGKFRCIDMESAYRAIHWPSIMLIVGMMPFALALQKTGGINLIVNLLMDIAGGMGARIMLLCLFIVCAVIGLFISNTATAILMAPIAIAVANQMNISPMPFAMVINVAASAAFMTPVSSPVNTLILAPGGYKFSDFLKFGIPFTFLVMAISIIIIPEFFPF
ncbi:SLC13 family permease [Arsenophonus nasoniae]|uniref:SLC13 family permease n=1 Tax=Arsenophonus nasoniae TaxID=638 RepID=A0AA95GG86_9GAMM|nr:SLC13 family permease [Arsenophonus nasoniae]WGL96429.1 SLC13 family permease [Arsenophonus nasoniae]